MVTSQNGYAANDRSHITTYLVGAKTKFALRKGPTGWLLAHFADWFDRNIKDIDAGAVMDDWSYAERPIRGSTTTLSNHASGTAIDVDATKWPLGVEPSKYLTKAEIDAVRRQLTVYEGAIRWGGDYTGRKDPMHFEINRDEAFCARIQAKLQDGKPTKPAPGETETSEEDDDMKLSSYRSDPAHGGNGSIWLGGPATWEQVPTPTHYGMLVADGMCAPFRNVSPAVLDYYRAIWLSSEANDREVAAAVKRLEDAEVARRADAAAVAAAAA